MPNTFLGEKKMNNKEYRHIKEECVAYHEGGMGCPDCYCDSSCKDDSCHICGGNTPERVEEQIEWLKKKTTQKVAEQHKEAFEKLAENKMSGVFDK